MATTWPKQSFTGLARGVSQVVLWTLSRSPLSKNVVTPPQQRSHRLSRLTMIIHSCIRYNLYTIPRKFKVSHFKKKIVVSNGLVAFVDPNPFYRNGQNQIIDIHSLKRYKWNHQRHLGKEPVQRGLYSICTRCRKKLLRKEIIGSSQNQQSLVSSHQNPCVGASFQEKVK